MEECTCNITIAQLVEILMLYDKQYSNTVSTLSWSQIACSLYEDVVANTSLTATKEYISKNELKIPFTDYKRKFWENTGILEQIDRIPVVTEDDMCKEFANKIYEIITADMEDKTKVLKIQEYIFNIKGIEQNESETV